MKNIFNIFKRKKKEVISFQQSFDLTSLPVITLYQGTGKFNFLLDTGSTDNVIDSNVLPDLEHKPIENSASSLTGMEGNPVKASITMINLYYQDTAFPFGYLVNDMSKIFGSIKKETGVNIHGILGSKFFNYYKYVLDFDKMVAYNKK